MTWRNGNNSTWGFLLALAFALAAACTPHDSAENARAPLSSATPANIIPPTSSAAPSTPATALATPDAGTAPSGSAAPSSGSGTAAPSAGKMCGGIAGIRCPEQQYCAFSLEAKCGAGDMSGTCTQQPQICNYLMAPVCGCDGKTYPNGCHAARAGVSVAAQGACKNTVTPRI